MPTTLQKKTIAALLKPRRPDTNKSHYGHALLVAGNTGKMGAAVLAARACLRSGTGLTTVNVPKEERFIIQTAVPETMMNERESIPANLEKYTAVGIGPGMGTQQKDEDRFYQLLINLKQPLLLDADAITILAAHKNWWALLPKGTIFTPHGGEFERMFGPGKSKKDRLNKAMEISRLYGWVIVLKGHETAIVSYGKYMLNKTGNTGLAKGGSGDVLTGMITAFLAQGYEPVEAASLGVYLHGAAADLALKKQSAESMIAGDVIECIGAAFKGLIK
ncbi:MAG: NAD(P)H-hydrate dehydratase [Ferruginibacter sp.]